MTKILLPKRREDVLSRSRLVHFIHQHIDRRLLLVCAPAGFGKTTLLTDFAYDSGIPICWYAIDSRDSDPRVFLEYLIAAIHYRFPNFGQRTHSLIQTVNDVSKDTNLIIGCLVNEIITSIPEYFVLVLDDFHLVDGSKPVATILDLFLRHLPDNCHIVLSSRTIPGLTLTRLAAHRQVAGIGISDLRFTPEEIRHFMSQNHKLLMTDKQAEEISRQSEGWITGIILTTHTMWKGLFESMVRAKGSNSPVFEYLASEVFEQQTPDLKDFLLSSSVLTTMSTEFCNQLLDRQDSGEILEFLDENNLFISALEGEHPWYRYHHLFQQFLQEKLQHDLPEKYVELHSRAGALHEKQANIVLAIDHYFSAEMYDQAARIIDIAAEQEINRGSFETAERWLSALPEGILQRRPGLLIHKGRIAIRNGKLDEAIITLTPEILPGNIENLQAAELLLWRSTAHRLKGHFLKAKEDCKRALKLAANVGPVAAAAHQEMGICQCMEGDYAKGIEQLERSLALYDLLGNRYKAASLHHALGEAYTTTVEYKRAAAHYQEALEEWERIDNTGLSAFTQNSIGVLYFLQGKANLARATLEDALKKAREVGHLRAEAYSLASLSDLDREQSKNQEALEAGQKALDLARQIDESTLVAYCLDALGKTYAIAKDFPTAERMIRQALQLAENRKLGLEVGFYKSSLGRLLSNIGEMNESVSLLEEACVLFKRSGARRELARTYLHLGNSLYKTKRTAEALGMLDLALQTADSDDLRQGLRDAAGEVLLLLKFAGKKCPGHPIIEQILEAADKKVPDTMTRVTERSVVAVARETRMPIRSFAFGQSRVFRGNDLVTNSDWAVEKTREMFFYFALSTPKWHRKENIIERLWPEIDDSRGNSQFHSTTYRLRRALSPDILIYENGLYTLDLNDTDWLDVFEFEKNLSDAQQHPRGSPEFIAGYQKAIGLYEGPLLEDLYSDWCQDYRAKLERDFLNALHETALLFTEKGDIHLAIAFCERALAIDYYREETHFQLVQLYARNGERIQAARHFKKYVEFLKDELGVSPAPNTLEKFQQIIFHS